jgi:hypothetical protein
MREWDAIATTSRCTVSVRRSFARRHCLLALSRSMALNLLEQAICLRSAGTVMAWTDPKRDWVIKDKGGVARNGRELTVR